MPSQGPRPYSKPVSFLAGTASSGFVKSLERSPVLASDRLARARSDEAREEDSPLPRPCPPTGRAGSSPSESIPQRSFRGASHRTPHTHSLPSCPAPRPDLTPDRAPRTQSTPYRPACELVDLTVVRHPA